MMMKTIKKLKTISILLVLCIVFTNSAGFSKSLAENIDYKSTDPYIALASQVDGTKAFSFVEELVSDEYEGRLSGTEGADKAANWIAQQFRSYGLLPGGNKENTSYFQPFDVPLYEVLPPTSLSMKHGEDSMMFEYSKDFAVIPFSGSGSASGPLAFAGYGIQEDGHDDFFGIDLEGNIALMLRRSPSYQDFSQDSLFFSTKINLAHENGAIGALIMDLPGENRPYSLNMKPVRGIKSEIPVFFISPKAANAIFDASDVCVQEIIEKIEETNEPFSFIMDCYIEMETLIRISEQTTSNVIGYFPSRQATDDSILIVAHYDHLGIDLINQDLFPGANDNASGTGTLMEVARAMTYHCFTIDVNIVFIAFSGEEIGLLGSFYYVENPLFPLENIRAVFNMDMVGTGTGELVAGTCLELYPQLYRAIETSASELSIQVRFLDRLLNSGSDHFPFHRNGIPNVFFIRNNPTGLGGYHTPDDTIDSIDAKNLEETGRVIFLALMKLSEPLFMVIDTCGWEQDKTNKPYLRFYGLGNYAFKVDINEFGVTQGDHARFFFLLYLAEGTNLIHITLSDNNETVYEKIYTINANIQPELAADFNNDGKVNIQDLLYFSQFFGKQAHPTNEWAVCDLNRDGIIDEKDLALLKQYLGYRSN